jgi:hypothetical protein
MNRVDTDPARRGNRDLDEQFKKRGGDRHEGQQPSEGEQDKEAGRGTATAEREKDAEEGQQPHIPAWSSQVNAWA